VVKGRIHLISTINQSLISSISCSSSSPLKQIRAGYSKDTLTHILLQRDKSLNVITLNPKDYSEDGSQEYEDPVNRIGWVDCDLSRNCEYLGGALADPREHKLYVWDLSNSALVKVIDGPKEDVVAMRWHPHQPVLVSVSVSGKVYIWTRNTSEDWSAFAPNFTVLEENEEYVEREDEFDNPIVKPAGSASACADAAAGCNGVAAATPRQRIEIIRPVDSSDSFGASSNGRVTSTRDVLVHLPFKPRRRAVEASQVGPCGCCP
jgi:WD40 repeat protein